MLFFVAHRFLSRTKKESKEGVSNIFVRARPNFDCCTWSLLDGAQARAQPGFSIATCQVVLDASADINVRQAAAVQTKQHFMRSWTSRDLPEQVLIPEEEKVMWRTNIIDCVNASSDLIRAQLKEVVRRMIDEEFPAKWVGFPEKLLGCMASDDPRVLSGSLFVLHQIMKKHEFKKLDDPARIASDTLLREAQPRLLQVAAACLASGTADAFFMLKWALKIYCTSIMYEMPMFFTAPDSFRAWIDLFIKVIEVPVPKPADDDVDEWPKRPVWKAKKWAVAAIFQLFNRYGVESQASLEYQPFAKMYTEQYSVGILQVVWKQIKATVSPGGAMTYMPPSILSRLLRYVETALEPSQTWKLMKPMVPELIETILFPLMCFSEKDQELWEEDPSEYVRAKTFDGWGASPSPHMAAAVVLIEMTKKRPKQTLDIVYQFITKVLTKNAEMGAAANPRYLDGALHIAALIGGFIANRPRYKGILEQMLMQFVFPLFGSPHAFLRYRACHVLHTFAGMEFQNQANVTGAIEATLKALQDTELPVRVQASIALNHLVEEQQMACQALAPHIKDIVGVLLRVLHESESDDIPSVLDKLMETFPTQLAPFAAELSQQLTAQFMKLLDYDQDDIDGHRPIVAFNTITSLKNVIHIVDDSPEAMVLQEQVCVPLAAYILNTGVMDFIEEAFELLEIFTMTTVSVSAWQGFEVLYTRFVPGSNVTDFFVEICPFMYNLIKCGLGSGAGVPEKAPAAIFAMCKAMFESDKGEDVWWHAGRMLENFMIWSIGKVDQYVPAIIGLAITKLLQTGEDAIKGTQMKIMCMNMVISGLVYSPQIFFQTLESVPTAAGDEPLSRKFLALWFMHAADFKGLHNRKLGIFALCRMLELPFASFPAHIQQVWPHLIGHFLALFSQLDVAYRKAAEELASDEEEELPSDDDAEYDSDGGVRDDDDVDVTLSAESYVQQLQAAAAQAEEGEEDEEEGDYGQHGQFLTSLDDVDRKPSEYEVFHGLLSGLQAKDAPAFAALMSQVTPEQRANLAAIEVIASQKANAAHQEQVKASGGYNFDGALAPQTFNFGGGGK